MFKGMERLMKLASLPNAVMAFGRLFSVVKVRLSCGGNTQEVEKTVEAALTVLLFLPLEVVPMVVSRDLLPVLVPVPPLVQTYKDELAPRKVKLIGSGWPGTSSGGAEVFSKEFGTSAICAWPGKANINVMHNISSVMQDCSREWFMGDLNPPLILISFADFIGSPRHSNRDAGR